LCTFICIATCLSLPAPENGNVQCMPGTPTPAPEPTPQTTETVIAFRRSAETADNMLNSVAGDVCTFTCDEGYQLSGSENRTCGGDGTWDGTTSTCTVPPGISTQI